MVRCDEVSIVVCTADRAGVLGRCLHSLEPFRAAGVEVVVVDNGRPSTAVEIVAARCGARWVWEPRRGLGAARNCGIRAARGSLLVFIDDDARAEPDWLSRLLAPFDDPEVSCVAGGVRAENLPTAVSQVFDRWVRGAVPPVRLTLDAQAQGCRFPLRLAMHGLGGNIAFRRSAFERFGCFDERFGRGTRIGSGEDTERLFALLLGGAKIVCEPSAVVVHDFPTEKKALSACVFRSAAAHMALLVKYFVGAPHLRKDILGYLAARGLAFLHRPATGASPSLPRIPLLLGSCYGPVAYWLSSPVRSER